MGPLKTYLLAVIFFTVGKCYFTAVERHKLPHYFLGLLSRGFICSFQQTEGAFAINKTVA